MPDHPPDSSVIQDDGGSRVLVPEPVTTARPRVEEGGRTAGAGVDEFLAALEQIWDVPVANTGMAVAFDAHGHA